MARTTTIAPASLRVMSTYRPGSARVVLPVEVPQQGPRPLGVVARPELGGGEVGDTGGGQAGHLFGDLVLRADEGDVAGPGGTLLVEHRPVRGQVAVDGEDLVGPLTGRVRIVGDTDRQGGHDPRGVPS